MKIKDFNRKYVYITGGSSGIGLATAMLLASRGANLVIFGRRWGLLEEAGKNIEKNRVSETQRFQTVKMDVSDRAEVQATLLKSVTEFGIPDLLINSAGISYPQKFEDIGYDKFDEVVKINLYGSWNTISVLAPYMKQRGGCIVNIASVAGFVGVFGMSAYSASKFAVIGLSEVLRNELRPFNVTVSVLCPPDVDTPMLELANKIKPEETKAISSTASVMTAEQVARSLIKGVGRGQSLILPNAGARFTYHMSRLFPWLVELVTDRQISRVKREHDNTGHNKTKL